MQAFDLTYQLAYYKAYHLHPKNVQIHLYCIPLILATALGMLMTYKPVAYAMMSAYSLYYLILNIPAGLISTFFLVSTSLLYSHLYQSYPALSVLYPTLAVHLAAWGLQFFGHFEYEKKRPAVFDNLLQPLVLAPYFVVFEVFFSCGLMASLEEKMVKEAHVIRAQVE